MVTAGVLGAGVTSLKAQVIADTPVPKAVTLEELSQPELLKSYLQLREQLHAAQLALANNRAEADAAARAQAAAYADKLVALRATVDAERERQQLEIARSNAERDSQQADMQHLTHTVLWVAAVFGGVGLIVMLLMPIFQWRAVNTMAELAAQRAQAPTPYGLMPPEPAAALDQTVSQSNQRLESVIERMERRILEMEQTAAPARLATGAKASTKTEISSSGTRVR